MSHHIDESPEVMRSKSLIKELTNGNLVQIIDIDFLESMHHEPAPTVFGTGHYLDLRALGWVYMPLSDD